jgi:imidazolonepropionase-like amidohydrolase
MAGIPLVALPRGNTFTRKPAKRPRRAIHYTRRVAPSVDAAVGAQPMKKAFLDNLRAAILAKHQLVLDHILHKFHLTSMSILREFFMRDTIVCLLAASARRICQFQLLCLTLTLAHAQTGTSPDVGVRFQPPTTVFLKNAHVVVSAAKELPSANVVIEHGKLKSIGAELEVPSGAEVIDFGGKYLYPAFVDAMVEFDATSTDSQAGYWNDSVTPETRMDRGIQIDKAKLESLRKAGVGLVLAAPSRGIIKGQSCVVSTADRGLADILVRPQAFQHIRLYPNRGARERYPNSPMGAVALVRQALLDADWYQRAQRAVAADGALPQPEFNAALSALEAVLQGEQTIVIDGTNELYALRADRLAREFSLKLAIRGSGREYRRLDAIAATNRTYIIPVDFPDAPELDNEMEVADATLQSLMHWRLAPENPGRLEKAGINFVLTSDGLSKPSEMLSKLRAAIAHGLSKERALRSVTQDPASLLAVEHLAGTLEAGKLANLIVASGPLFDESTEIEETWVQGQRHQWKKEQSVDLRGSWELGSEQEPAKFVLKLDGKPEKLTAKIGLPEAFEEPAEAKELSEAPKEDGEKAPQGAGEEAAEESSKAEQVALKDVTFDGYRLNGTFDAKLLDSGQAGKAWLSAVVLTEAVGQKLQGTMLWPDGSKFLFSGALASNEGQAASDESEAADADASDSKTNVPDTKASTAESIACEVNFPLGAYGRSAMPEPPKVVLIKNATIWTCGEDGLLEAADVIVRDGIFEAIGKDLEVPEDAVVVDASGMHLSPGIIDCHSHMATDGGVNESGQAVTAEVRIGDFIDPNDITIYWQLAGGVTTSNILHGSANPIGGQNQVIKLRWGGLDEDLKMKEAPAGIKFALGENVKQSRSADSTRYPRSRMGVEQIIRDRFEAAKLYQQRWKTWSTDPDGLPPRRDLELEAIAEILDGDRWVHCHSYRQDEILMVLRTLEDYGVTIGSLQHILEGYKVADAMAAHGATGSSFSDWWAYKLEVTDAIPFNGAVMHRAGVVVSFNSDDRELARHLNHEAAKAVKYGGIEPMEALKFVTLNPAKQLRIDQYVGSIEVGKQADFVLWNRSPLSTLSVCMQTWVDGRKYFDRQEDEQRRLADAELRRKLIQAALSQGVAKGSSASDKDPSLWWARHDEFCHHSHDDDDDRQQHAGGH